MDTKLARLKQLKDQVTIGLEYLIKVTKGKKSEPVFYCVLCDNVRIDFSTVLCHLTAFTHRLNYLVS